MAELKRGDLERPLEWQANAACQQYDPGMWYQDGISIEANAVRRHAKAICVGECAVRVECLDYALTHHEMYGVWAGLSERELRKVKKIARQEQIQAPEIIARLTDGRIDLRKRRPSA